MKQLLSNALKDSLYVLQIAAVVAVPVALLMCLVWNQFRITELGYEVADKTQEQRELLEEERKLRIETTFQSHSQRETAMAGEDFGLRPVRPGQVISIDERDEQDETGSERAALDARAR